MLDVVIQAHAIHIGARFHASFQRTLRLPDDGGVYPLPPGLGVFPVFKVDDYRERVPPSWRESGGAFIPMYQREALWLGFDAAAWKPNAVHVGVGGFNAVSGEPFSAPLQASPQNYLVCPDQPWLDGINSGRGVVRQFVAMPLGLGYSVEASLGGRETVGGLQLTVFEPKPGIFPDAPPAEPPPGAQRHAPPRPMRVPQSMGLGAGGAMRQKIYTDKYGVDTWDPHNCAHVAVHIVNSEEFFEITGTQPPEPPIDAQTYTAHGLPWFDLYDETRGAIAPSERLTGAKTIAARDAELGQAAADATVDVPGSQVRKLAHGEPGAADHRERRGSSKKGPQ